MRAISLELRKMVSSSSISPTVSSAAVASSIRSDSSEGRVISNLQAMARRATCSQKPPLEAELLGRDRDRSPRLVTGI